MGENDGGNLVEHDMDQYFEALQDWSDLSVEVVLSEIETKDDNA